MITNIEKDPGYLDLRNYELNKHYLSDLSIPAFTPILDILNHYQHKTDFIDLKHLKFDCVSNYLLYKAPSNYNENEEVSFSYIKNPSSFYLLQNYGFFIPKNMFNFKLISVESKRDKVNFSNLLKQIKNCKKRVFESQTNLQNSLHFNLKITNLDECLIIYARIINLNNNFPDKEILNDLEHNKRISIENEITSWMFYYKSLTKETSKKMSLKKSISKTQKYRSLCNKLEKKSLEMESNKLWIKNKKFEYIYTLHYTTEQVSVRHQRGSLNNLIVNLNTDLLRLRSNYI